VVNVESIRQVMSALPKMAAYRISGISVGSSSLTQAVVKVLTDRERLREATPCEVFACHRHCSKNLGGNFSDCEPLSKPIVDGLWSMIEPSFQNLPRLQAKTLVCLSIPSWFNHGGISGEIKRDQAEMAAVLAFSIASSARDGHAVQLCCFTGNGRVELICVSPPFTITSILQELSKKKTKCGTISLALDQTPNGFEAIVFIADNFIQKAGDLEAIDAYRKKFGPVRLAIVSLRDSDEVASLIDDSSLTKGFLGQDRYTDKLVVCFCSNSQ